MGAQPAKRVARRHGRDTRAGVRRCVWEASEGVGEGVAQGAGEGAGESAVESARGARETHVRRAEHERQRALAMRFGCEAERLLNGTRRDYVMGWKNVA